MAVGRWNIISKQLLLVSPRPMRPAMHQECAMASEGPPALSITAWQSLAALQGAPLGEVLSHRAKEAFTKAVAKIDSNRLTG